MIERIKRHWVCYGYALVALALLMMLVVGWHQRARVAQYRDLRIVTQKQPAALRTPNMRLAVTNRKLDRRTRMVHYQLLATVRRRQQFPLNQFLIIDQPHLASNQFVDLKVDGHTTDEITAGQHHLEIWTNLDPNTRANQLHLVFKDFQPSKKRHVVYYLD